MSASTELKWRPMGKTIVEVTAGECSRGGKSRWKTYIKVISLAGLATFIQWKWFAVSYEKSDLNREKIAVLAARGKLRSGERLSVENTSVIWVQNSQLADAFILSSHLQNVLGKSIRFELSDGAALPRMALDEISSARAELYRIPQGKRLFVMEMNPPELSSVLRKGDKIDVVGRLDLPDKGSVVKTLLANETIVSIDDPEKTTQQEHVIGIYVTPEDFQFLMQAKRFGSFSLALRNPGDRNRSEVDGLTLSQFLDDRRIREMTSGDLFAIRRGPVGSSAK